MGLAEKLSGLFLRHKLCKQPPCLYEQAFPGQRTANGFAVSCLWYRGGQGKEISPCPINGNGGFKGYRKDINILYNKIKEEGRAYRRGGDENEDTDRGG